MRLDLFVVATTVASGVHAAEPPLLCRPDGPVVPRPLKLAESPAFKDAVQNLTATMEAALSGGIKAGWHLANTSFSVGVISIAQDDPSVPLWEYHHLGSANVNGTKKLDRNSQYLIGSISKVLSDYLYLKSGIDLDTPVTQYLPELRDPESPTKWTNVTLRALTSQLSGMVPNYGFSEYYYIKSYFEKLGFPHIEDSEFPECGVIGLNTGCSKQQLLEGMTKVYPIAAPMTRPVYSNVAFTLLAYAVEAHTGKNYTQLLDEYLVRDLGMTNTIESPGNDSIAVIPPIESTWGSDYGDASPGGGLVSTLADLSTFQYRLLTKTMLSDPTAVREWLQPRAFAGSPNSFVGAPWEIFQPQPGVLTPQHPHSITLYAKGGAAYGYRSQMAVIDEYGVGVVVLTAGDQAVATPLYSAVLSTIIPGVDGAAREEAKSKYSGRFRTQNNGTSSGPNGTNPTTATVAATIAMDANSLLLENLTRGDQDILEAIRELWMATMGTVLPDVTPPTTFRLYPTDISSTGFLANGETKVVRRDWRFEFGSDIISQSELPGFELAKMDCLSWALVDWIYYGGEPLDRLVWVEKENGDPVGWEVPFLRSEVLVRV